MSSPLCRRKHFSLEHVLTAKTRSIILDALGLSSTSPSTAGNNIVIKRNAIVEAEMVAFADDIGRVDEFWRIRSLIASTAIGPRHRAQPKKPVSRIKDSQDDTQDTDMDDVLPPGWYIAHLRSFTRYSDKP